MSHIENDGFLQSMFTVLFAIFTTSMTIIWSSVFILAGLFGFRLQKVGGDKLRMFYSKVKYASVWTEEDTPDHWIIGYPFIGYIYSQQTGQHGGESRVLYLFTSIKWYKTNVNGISNNVNESPKNIILYDRVGAYWNLKYESRSILPPQCTPYDYQINAINGILNEFNSRGNATALLYGPPRGGKSNIPLLLARTLLDASKQVSFVDTFNPTEPNDSFSALYTRINPSKDKPLIVVLEEIDGIVFNMHIGIKRHEHMPIQITCKAEWNKWLDRFDRGYYPGVFLIMTSNKSIEYFNDLDSSYFGVGRVNIKIHISRNI